MSTLQEPAKRRRAALIAILVCILVPVVLLSLSLIEHLVPNRPAHTDLLVVARGTLAGKAWELETQRSQGKLCFTVHEEGGEPNGTCQFGNHAPFSTFDSGPVDVTRTFWFGPLPKNAAKVMIAPGVQARLGSLPKSMGYDGEKFWVWGFAGTPPKGLYDRPRVTDSSGSAVKIPDFTN